MKHLLRIFALSSILLFGVQQASALTERFKVMEAGNKTHTCVTEVINISNEREGNFCTYIFTPFVGGKNEGTLSFEFLLNPNNETSALIKQQMVAILRDLKTSEQSRIVLTLHMSNGERLYFDSNMIPDWKQSDWTQLLHIRLDKATGEIRSTVMFPIEYMCSSLRDLPDNLKKRHTYILNELQNFSIEKLTVYDTYGRVDIRLDVPFERPTDGTFSDMVQKVKKNL